MPDATIHTLSCEDALAFVCESAWGFAIVDDKGYFTWVNRAYCEILQAPADLIIGTKFGDWTFEEDLEIDLNLAKQVKAGEIPGYTLAKRYRQRGSTPQRPRLIWGMLSVQGKHSPTGEVAEYLVQFRPFDDQTAASKPKFDWLKIAKWATENWKTIATVLAMSSSLIWGSSSTVSKILRDAKEAADSVDSALESSSSGVSAQPSSQ